MEFATLARSSIQSDNFLYCQILKAHNSFALHTKFYDACLIIIQLETQPKND